MARPELEFTGERIVPGRTPEALFSEHEARYIFAGQYVSGKEVLDIACGTGVGTSFLRRAGARRVQGLDIDPDAIAFAKATYGDCEFGQSDATDLCLPSGSVDVVVSFETLEHVRDQQKFLMECQRVLRPGGALICSTPNITVYRWFGTNPYHQRELTTGEFTSLLTEHFIGLTLFSQSEEVYPLLVLRSVVIRLRRVIVRSLDRLRLKRPIQRILRAMLARDEMRQEFSVGAGTAPHGVQLFQEKWLKRPTYLVAICWKGHA